MSDLLLEDEIRDALARRAADVSPAAVARVAAVDYARPACEPKHAGTRLRVPSRLRLRATIGAGATAAAVGGTVAVVLLSSGAPNAYAGWTPVPTTPTQAQVNAATAACRAMHPGPLAMSSGDHRVLTDARGRYTAVVTASGSAAGICIADGHRGNSVGGVNLVLAAKPGPRQVDQPIGGGGTARGFGGGEGGEEYRLGRAGSDVTGVKLIFAGGGTVAATVQHRWYFAWWPYSERARLTATKQTLFTGGNPTRIEVTFSSGKTQTASLQSRPCRGGQPGCIFPGPNAAWQRLHHRH